jgi:hypothetical protein
MNSDIDDYKLTAHKCEVKRIWDHVRCKWITVEVYDIGRPEPLLDTWQWPGMVGQPRREGRRNKWEAV